MKQKKQKLDRNRAKDLLLNWRQYARDLPPDSAEILYYTISPMFRDYVKPTPKWIRYDEDAALMVEDVLRDMFGTHPKDREMLILYWIHMRNVRDLAEALGMPKSTVHDRIKSAEDTFSVQWYLTHGRG
jgi:DNA-directed RNA polymerase specialized sigma24 family protein